MTVARKPPRTSDGRLRQLTAATATCITAVLVGVGLAGAGDTVASERPEAAKVDRHALRIGDGRVTTAGAPGGSACPAGSVQPTAWE